MLSLNILDLLKKMNQEFIALLSAIACFIIMLTVIYMSLGLYTKITGEVS